ncbi:hypothetical protein ATN81_27345 [Agrobacterium pusense]|uniref:Uncharacterized protein n=1 Tax=Agrobacterium genomosp. 2 str. CFBP 5494 TaxID=1183436 RepID=A0A9W5F389_9HYPH|nr:hypothetical protein ATN81_27345 [Agrobacterium pusense]CAD7058254.1 hypothetical protein RP007_05786 [Rhizobium sp. P007]CUX02583.1 hypothetical protein AGR2A_pa60070 [Agrobacterium genomosp. 2 str. CFBP 5494]
MIQNKARKVKRLFNWPCLSRYCNVPGVNLPTTRHITSIVKDPALSRGLAFALRAYGYDVASFRSWKHAGESVGGAICVILDGSLPECEREACLATLPVKTPVLFLAEDETFSNERPSIQILHKPLTGTDIVSALMRLGKNP